MLPNVGRVVVELINSVLAPVPGFARGYTIIGVLAGAFWVIGLLGNEDSDDPLAQVFQGINNTGSTITQIAELIVLKCSKSRCSGLETVVDIFDGTFEGELAGLAVPAARA